LRHPKRLSQKAAAHTRLGRPGSSSKDTEPHRQDGGTPGEHHEAAGGRKAAKPAGAAPRLWGLYRPGLVAVWACIALPRGAAFADRGRACTVGGQVLLQWADPDRGPDENYLKYDGASAPRVVCGARARWPCLLGMPTA